MAKKQRETFVPLHELIQSPPRRLSEKQREVIEAHKKAKEAMAQFARSGEKRTIGITHGYVPEFSTLEISASGFSMVALREAIEYYHQHNQLPRAFTEVQQVAREYWHPVINEMWNYHFQRRAEDAGITLPASVSRKIGDPRIELMQSAIADIKLRKHSERNGGKPN